MKRDYDLIVIGGGAAGLTSAGIGASFGAKTAMIEANKLGGDCTWTGCVPSKTLLHIAKTVHLSRKAADFGLSSGESKLDFKKVIERVHQIREEVYEDADKPEIYENMGIDVMHGYARFTDSHTVEITASDGSMRRYSSRKFIIATGSRPRELPIEGLEESGFLTNETLFELNEQPGHLVIVGGGPIGCEMAQAFTRLGSEVSVIERSERIMPRDHAELTPILQEKLSEEGVQFLTNAKLVKVEGKTGDLKLFYAQGDEIKTIHATHLLIAAGRVPNVDTLALENTGVHFSDSGIQVNDKCRTNITHIFAAGDVTGRPAFTHNAEHMAKTAATNALLRIPQKMDLKHLPWTTFTDPELAHIGATEDELKEKGVKYRVYKFPYSKVDRAVTEEATTGWIRIYAKPFSGKILGADALGISAGEVISEYALAMKNGISLMKISDTIHPYPTYGLGARRAADQWYVQKQKPWITKTIQWIFGYRGPVQDYDPDRIL